MKKALVTGGAGFIGNHLCEKLLQENYIVYCVDNLYTGALKNVERFRNNTNFKFINHDIVNPFFVEVDEIYNLACPASPIHYLKSQEYTIKTNILGIYNILDIAIKNKSKILQTSTSEVYGDPLVAPQSENYFGNANTIGNRSCYYEAKRCVETILKEFNTRSCINVVIVRLFNVYGPFFMQDDGRVIPNFIINALQNKDIIIYGDGTQIRSFCYISDIIDGIYRCLQLNDPFILLNLGNSEEISILELAKKIIKSTGSLSKIKHVHKIENDPQRRVPDINYAKEKLNWTPAINLDSGIKKTLSFCF